MGVALGFAAGSLAQWRRSCVRLLTSGGDGGGGGGVAGATGPPAIVVGTVNPVTTRTLLLEVSAM